MKNVVSSSPFQGESSSSRMTDDFSLSMWWDTVYESPLLTLQNTQLLQHAVNLSHAVSDAQLPSLWPGAMVGHAAGVMRYGWRKFVGSGSSKKMEEQTRKAHTPQEKPKSDPQSARQLDSRQGQAALASAFARFHNPATTSSPATESRKKNQDDDAGGNGNWWKAWDVRSVCGEINEMETYGQSDRHICQKHAVQNTDMYQIIPVDGFRFGFVEQ
jgi:hypothetical protein